MSQRIIAILGPDHGGSTMLGAMLGSHKQWNAHPHLGEFHAFFLDVPVANKRFCAMGHQPCDKWKMFDKSTSTPHSHFMDTHGCDRVVDSSKNIRWFNKIPKNIKASYVYVWRDPSGIRNSYNKRFSAFEAERRYAKQILRMKEDLNWMDAHKRQVVSVSFESLLMNPNSVLREICEAIEMEYFEGKEFFWNFEHHHIGGAKSVKQALRNPESAEIMKPVNYVESDIQIEFKRMIANRSYLAL